MNRPIKRICTVSDEQLLPEELVHLWYSEEDGHLGVQITMWCGNYSCDHYHYRKWTYEPKEVTCLPCLSCAIDMGNECAKRLNEFV